MNFQKIDVIRNGRESNINPRDMVVGDLVKITGGLQISVDGFVIKANQLTTDEAAMTGETDPIKKGTISTAEKIRKEMEQEGER